MPHLRILADDLTGALDCAAAFGAGITVHLSQPPAHDAAPVSIVATATRDIAPAELPAHLDACVPWLSQATIAFKKVDSLLRGNTYDELDHIARAGRFAGLALAPAFPAQGRITLEGRQCVVRQGQGHAPVPVDADPMPQALAARGWKVQTGQALPQPALQPSIPPLVPPLIPPSTQPPTHPPMHANEPVAWVPDLHDDHGLMQLALQAVAPSGSQWLWAGSAGLAQALARQIGPLGGPDTVDVATGPDPQPWRVMLVSASHHAVTRGQWQVLRQSHHGADCRDGADPRMLHPEGTTYPRLIDLSPQERLTPQAAASLLSTQAALLARHAPRPDRLVLVGGDTLLALCRALGVQALVSQQSMDRSGWGCARMLGGRWDGLVCHTRSGAFGGEADLLEVLDGLTRA